jgi:hypothetical protein
MINIYANFYVWLAEVNDYLVGNLGITKWSQLEPDEEVWRKPFEDNMPPGEAAELVASEAYASNT